MRTGIRIVVFVSASLWMPAGCTTEQACTPGMSTPCTGAAGCSGGQHCNDEGSGFEVCICEGDTVCGDVVCNSPAACCGETCVDTTRDPANCGGCLRACLPNASCASSRCLLPPALDDAG